MEGTLGMAQRQHLGSCKSIRTEREEVKVPEKKAEESALQAYWGGGGQGTMVSVLLQPLCA